MKEPKRYSVGIEFIDVLDEEKARLKKFLDTLPSNAGKAWGKGSHPFGESRGKYERNMHMHVGCQ